MEKGLVAGSPGASIALQLRISDTLAVPQYLEQTYWWAYLHPKGVRFFERQWLVNLILWGNFARLRDAALEEMGPILRGRTLQVACVYGDFTPRVAERLAPDARLDVVDVAPVQLENVKRKLKHGSNVHLHHQDSTELAFRDGEFDHVVVFFLLHEQPEDVRKKTVCEALRVVKPGGRVVFVDYHRPSLWNPFRYVMIPILHFLEPFALDMWRQEIVSWAGQTLDAQRLPDQATGLDSLHKETFFGGLYQKVVLHRAVADRSTEMGGAPLCP
ncbi:MAG: rhodoquinone biosynthesis methyltransferase RquA [Magnetococcus sp. MYC-9]